MKGERNRNFEAGIFTDEPTLVNSAIEQFDDVWIGSFCKQCGRRDVCKDPIAYSASYPFTFRDIFKAL